MIYEKTCKVCGKPFITNHPRYCVCGDECRQINTNIAGKRYWQNNREKVLLKRKASYKKRKSISRKIYYCKTCGGEVEHGKQTHCIDCLLKAYKRKDTRGWALHVLSCRGYDAETIRFEIEERGY